MTYQLQMVIDALRAAGDTETAAGVEDCARHARFAIPTYGLTLTHEKYDAIDRIAGEHFGFYPLKRAMLRKLQAEIKALERRDPVETAIWSTIEASDRAHYYYGLVTGLLLVPASVVSSTQTATLPAGLLDRPGRARTRRRRHTESPTSGRSGRPVVQALTREAQDRSKGAGNVARGRRDARNRRPRGK